MRVVEGLPSATETGGEETAIDTNAAEPTFEAFYRTHAKRIYSLAYRFTGNSFRTAAAPHSCCMMSRVTSTGRSPRCSASRPAPPSRRCTGLACGSVRF